MWIEHLGMTQIKVGNVNIYLDIILLCQVYIIPKVKLLGWPVAPETIKKDQIKMKFVQEFDSIPSIINDKLDIVLISKAEIDNPF